MKIKRVQVKNMRSLSSVDCCLSKVNFILGANNMGKSSLLNAIQYGVTNECSFSSKLQDLRRKKGGDAYDGIAIGVDIDGLGNVMRYCKTSSQINRLNKETVPDTKILENIQNAFGFGYSTIGIMFDAGKFTAMSPKEQKAFLLKLIGIKLNADTIISYMDEPSEEAKNIVKDIIKGEMSIEDFDALYKRFYNERSIIKKKVKDVSLQRESLEKNIPEIDVEKEEEIKIALEKLKEELSEIVKLVTLANERTSRKQTILESITKLETNLEIVKNRIDSNYGFDQEEVDKLEQEIILLEKEKNADEREIGSCNEGIRRFNELKNKLNTKNCPLSDKLVCNANKQPLFDEFDKNIKEYETKRDALLKKIENTDKKIVSIKERQKKIKNNIENQNWIVTRNELLETRKKELSSLEIPDIKGIETKKKELEEQSSKYNNYLNNIDRYKKTKKDLESIKKEETKVNQEITLYEYLVKEFEPNGVRSRILKKLISPLQDAAQKEMNILENGASLKFNLEGDGFEVVVENETGIVPLTQLSASEKLRAQIVIQNIVNKLTGVGLLVIDEASMLDENNFKKLIELINSIEDNYGTILIAMTCTKEEIQKNDKLLLSCCNGDSSLFWVENGTIEKM